MADQLATAAELASLLQVDSVDTATANLLLQLATGKIQGACGGQRLVAATSTFVIDVDICHYGHWLELPQLPVRTVSSVLIDAVAATDWYLRSQKLWRLNGWNTNSSAPTQVTVAAAHGYLDSSQYLQVARDACLAMTAAAYGNPGAVSSEQIDDYRVSYADAAARMTLTDAAGDLLRATYGTTAYVT